ncbi:MAG: 50S ribosomal protein L15 [Pseudomonadota bacterium]
MYLNTLRPHKGAKHTSKRLGRGIGSGKGKTSGRGHKGQKARSGGGVKAGFEGGQMPIQRRLPKFGFRSRKALVADEIRTHELNRFDGEVTMQTLRESGLIGASVKSVKVIAHGDVEKPLQLSGLKATKGARTLIEAAGGAVKD